MNNVIINESLNTTQLISEHGSYNFNKAYHESRSINRVLAKMEDYFRMHFLLEKYEMLEIRHHKFPDLRCEFMNLIARQRGWLYGDEYLRIVK